MKHRTVEGRIKRYEYDYLVHGQRVWPFDPFIRGELKLLAKDHAIVKIDGVIIPNTVSKIEILVPKKVKRLH